MRVLLLLCLAAVALAERACRPKVAAFLACANRRPIGMANPDLTGPQMSQAQFDEAMQQCLDQSGCARPDVRNNHMHQSFEGRVYEAIGKCQSESDGADSVKTSLESCMSQQEGYTGFAFASPPPSGMMPFMMGNNFQWSPMMMGPVPPIGMPSVQPYKYNEELRAILGTGTQCSEAAQAQLKSCISRLGDRVQFPCHNPVQSFLDSVTYTADHCKRLAACEQEQGTGTDGCKEELESVQSSLCNCARRLPRTSARPDQAAQDRLVQCVTREAGQEAVREMGLRRIRSMVSSRIGGSSVVSRICSSVRPPLPVPPTIINNQRGMTQPNYMRFTQHRQIFGMCEPPPSSLTSNILIHGAPMDAYAPPS